MSLLYLVMCHRMQDAVADLIRGIWRPGHTYLLHVDAKAAPALHETAALLSTTFPNVHVLQPRLCAWGGWSLVEVLLAGIDRALALDAGWTHLLPLSEGHVPLCPPEVAAASLRPGISYIDAQPAMHMGPGQTPDIRHRFAARHRELPGVGMFPVGGRALSDAQMGSLHHASQWVALARDACERLAALPPAAPSWAPFRDSLIADETAIPSVLLGTDAGRGLAIERRATTFVAWPHLSGTEDWTFSEDNFFTAREAGCLFIRKRPAVLPPRVAAAQAALAVPAPWPVLPPPEDGFRLGGVVTALADALLAALRGLFADLAVDTLVPAHTGGSAACFLRLRCPALPEALRVVLISEDFVTFKAALIWPAVHVPAYDTRTLGDRTTWLLKVRLVEVFMAREVLLPELPDAGFVTLAPREGPARLAAALARALAAGIALAPALPGEG